MSDVAELLTRWQPRLTNWARWCRMLHRSGGDAEVSPVWDEYRSPQVWEPDPLPRHPPNIPDAEHVQALYARQVPLHRAVIRVWWHDPPVPKAERPRAVRLYLMAWDAYSPFADDALPAVRVAALEAIDTMERVWQKPTSALVGLRAL